MSCREAAVPQVPHGLVGVPRDHAATPNGAEGGPQVGGRSRLDRPAFEVADHKRHGPSKRLLDDRALLSPHLILSASAGRSPGLLLLPLLLLSTALLVHSAPGLHLGRAGGDLEPESGEDAAPALRRGAVPLLDPRGIVLLGRLRCTCGVAGRGPCNGLRGLVGHPLRRGVAEVLGRDRDPSVGGGDQMELTVGVQYPNGHRMTRCLCVSGHAALGLFAALFHASPGEGVENPVDGDRPMPFRGNLDICPRIRGDLVGVRHAPFLPSSFNRCRTASAALQSPSALCSALSSRTAFTRPSSTHCPACQLASSITHPHSRHRGSACTSAA